MLDSDKCELLVVLIISFVIQLFLSLLYHGPVDFIIHFDAARQISEGKILYYTVTAISTPGIFPYPDYPPIYPYLMGFLFYLFGPSKILMKLVLCIFNISCAVVLYFICLEMKFSCRRALAAVIIFLFHPSSLTMVISGFFDNFPVLFILLAFYFVHARNYRKNRLLLVIAGGITTGLGIMTKLFPVITIFIIIPVFIKSNKLKELACFLIASVTTILIISSPFLIFFPEEYIFHVLYHFQSTWINMSIYSTVFPQLYLSIVPFILQGSFLISVSSLIMLERNEQSTPVKHVQLYFILLSGFVLLNRVIYPHYVAWFIPFLVILMVKNERGNRTRLYLQIGCQIFLSLGGLLWSISWKFDLIGDPISILYGSGFLLFNISLFLLIIAELYWLIKETEYWQKLLSRT
ncbi:MAG: glycosyltransferase family 39 protein [Candidatus Hodarchaeales archaeon]